jgi:hypothetical protein
MTSSEVYTSMCLEEEKLRIGRFLAEIQTRHFSNASNFVVSLCLAGSCICFIQSNTEVQTLYHCVR